MRVLRHFWRGCVPTLLIGCSVAAPSHPTVGVPAPFPAATERAPTSNSTAASSKTVAVPPSTGTAPATTARSTTTCPLFPANNVWNTPITRLPKHPRSDQYVANIGPDAGLKADFGAGDYEGGPIGIPFTTVGAGQTPVQIVFDIDDESDPGPYPIPPNPPIEGGAQSSGDRHVLVVDQSTCILYEMWASYPQQDGSWQAGSGAKFDLNGNSLRPDGWTSADAAGLPILPGLVRYDEVASGAINHMIRFTVPDTQRAYVWPARHFASDITDPAYPPMGLRFRLRADFDISGFSQTNQVILTALKTYGMIVADNGSAWFMSGEPDNRWDNDDLQRLRQVHGSDFEAIDASALLIDPNSAQAKNPAASSFIRLALISR